jgi:hypothetical protein
MSNAAEQPPPWYEITERLKFGLPVPTEVPVAEIVLALQQIPGLREGLDQHERALLEAARDRGESWSSLAAKLGRGTEQAMQQRYRRLGGTKIWQASRTARNDRAVALGTLREASATADAAHTTPVDRIRAITALRRAISDVLDAGVLTEQEVQAATGCSDYTLTLARDIDYSGDDAVTGATRDDPDLRLHALELMLDEQWRNTESDPRSLLERPQHPAVPRPVRTWNELDPVIREDYLAQARVHLTQPPAPSHDRWKLGWRLWHQLLTLGTVVAERSSDVPGYWLLFDPAGVDPGQPIAEEPKASLAELSAAGLIIVNRAGDPQYPAPPHAVGPGDG